MPFVPRPAPWRPQAFTLLFTLVKMRPFFARDRAATRAQLLVLAASAHANAALPVSPAVHPLPPQMLSQCRISELGAASSQRPPNGGAPASLSASDAASVPKVSVPVGGMPFQVRAPSTPHQPSAAHTTPTTPWKRHRA